MPLSEEDDHRLNTINILLKMYDLHYEAIFKEGVDRPFRIVWTGNRASEDVNKFITATKNTIVVRFFESIQLMDDFVHKNLRKKGLQDV